VKPEDLLYAETHEWVYVEEQGGRKIATVGISAFAVEQLTDLVYMELPDVGTEVSAGLEFGEVESVKAVSPLYSPVSGTVIEVNSLLESKPGLINTDPYGKGWLFAVDLSNPDELDALLSADEYIDIIK